MRYELVAPGAVRPQDEVRVVLTDDAAVRLAWHYGSITKRLEGQLGPGRADSMLLSVWIGQNYVGTSFENARQSVSLGVREVMEVRRRRLSVARTAIAAAATLGVIGILVNRVAFLENPNAPTGRPRGDSPEPDPFLKPAGRIR